jgi:nucleoside-specific outer membrane channel protein Tsx
MQHPVRRLILGASALAAVITMHGAAAADWSDTSLGYRYGTHFAEPFNGRDITKNILSVTHASGGRFGNDFLNVDLLSSDRNDSSAVEAYMVYRHTADLDKLMGRSFAFGPVRGLGLTGGFDLNTKNDPFYASKKRMLVAGPTLKFNVPGFLDVSLLAAWESNKPVGIASRYSYDTHPMLAAAWGIPLGASGWSFEGYANYIAAKGRNEFGGPTAPETNFDAQLMYDFSALLGAKPKTIKAGIEYQYWRNKFGNPASVPGSLAKTPMARAEYHF